MDFNNEILANYNNEAQPYYNLVGKVNGEDEVKLSEVKLVLLNTVTQEGTVLNKSFFEQLENDMMLKAHPIHSLYWSSDSTDPHILFGGTWTRITDKFILAAGDTYANNSTGGSATTTLLQKNLPSSMIVQTNILGSDLGNVTVQTLTGAGNQGIVATNSAVDMAIKNTGGGQSINNLPPFVSKYCWERTA